MSKKWHSDGLVRAMAKTHSSRCLSQFSRLCEVADHATGAWFQQIPLVPRFIFAILSGLSVLLVRDWVRSLILFALFTFGGCDFFFSLSCRSRAELKSKL